MTTGLSVGEHSITAVYNGRAVVGAVYNNSTSTATTVTITKADQSISFNPLANVTYGSLPVLISSTSTFDLPVSYAVTGPATYDALTGQLNITGAGVVSITATQAGNDWINSAEPVVQSLTVIPATLTVTIDDKAMIYGGTQPELTYGIAGFVNDESSDILTSPTLSTATATSPAGSYVITATGLNANNYTVNYVPGTLTITPAQLSITVDDQRMVYGGTVPTPTYTVTGLVNEDSTDGTVTINMEAATSGVGVYDITPVLDNANYTVTIVPGKLIITAAPLTITANDQTMVYGGTQPTLTASLTGLVNGDTGTDLVDSLTLDTVSASSGVGTYNISIVGATSGNYRISYQTGTLTITPAALTITADNQTIVQGNLLPPLTASYSGLVNGDTPENLNTAVTLSTMADAFSDAGTYTINAADATDPNYTISYAAGSLVITRRASSAELTASTQAAVLGQAVTFATTVLDPGTTLPVVDGSVQFQVDGVSAGDPVALDVNGIAWYSTSALSLGSHTITAVYSGATNVQGATGSVTVTVAHVSQTNLTVSATDLRLGSSATLTATVAAQESGPSIGTPTGSVQFAVDGVAYGSPVAVNGLGVAVLGGLSELAVGTHQLTATFTDATGTFATSLGTAALNVFVAADQSVMFQTPTSANFGDDSIDLVATAGSGLPVSFTLVSGPATLSGGRLTFTGVGNVVIRASQAGNNFYNAATAEQTISVGFFSQPIGATIIPGDPVTFTAVASVQNAADLQWQVSTDAGTTWSNINGATSTTYGFNGNQGQSGSQFRARFSWNGSTVFTRAATVLVQSAPLVTTQPADAALGLGQVATFSVAYRSVTAATVQWQSSSDGGVSWSDLAGETGDSYTAPPVSLANAGTIYRAAVINSFGLSLSSSGALRLQTATSLSASRSSATYGDQVTLTASLASAGTNLASLQAGQVQFEVDGVNLGSAASLANGQATIVISSLNTGTHQIVARYTDPAGRVLGSASTPITVTITKAHLTLSVANQTKTYDGTGFSGLVATLSGFVNGETASTAVTGSATVLGSALTAVNAGTYTLTPAVGTLAAANYDFPTLNSGTLIIAPKALTASIVGTFTKVYDGTTTATLTAASYSLIGFVGSESLSVTKTTGTYASKNVGTGLAISATLAATDFTAGANTLASNYALPTTATGAGIGTITARGLAVTFVGVNKVYDGTTSVAPLTLTDNRVAGDVLSASYSSASFSDKNAGYKTINLAGISLSGRDATNYTFNTTASNPANITQLALTGTVTVSNKVYDGTTNASIAAYSLPGMINGDVVSLTGGTASFADKTAANGKTVTVTGLALTGANAANYTVNSTASTTANITKAALTVSAIGVNKVYDGTTSATVVLTDNRVNGDVFTDSYASASFTSASVASGVAISVTGIAISGADAANYTVNSTASTTANISAGVAAPAVVTQPAAQNVLPGTVATFSAAGGGTPTTTTWQVSSNNGTTWATASGTVSSTTTNGVTTSTLSVTTALANNGQIYRAVFSNSAGSATTNTASLTVAAATISSVGVLWGTKGTATLVTNADGLRLLPTGRTNSIPWLNINRITVTLSRAVPTLAASDIRLTSVVAGTTTYSVTGISGSGTTWTITFANNSTTPATAANGIVDADKVTVTIGNGQLTSTTRRLDVLPGDVNDDLAVNSLDSTIVKNYYLVGIIPTQALTFLDTDGNGIIDVNDYNLITARVGKKLPA